MKLLLPLPCVCLVACLALLPFVPRSPAPRAPTLPEESAALWANLARIRAQLRQQQAEVTALRLRFPR